MCSLHPSLSTVCTQLSSLLIDKTFCTGALILALGVHLSLYITRELLQSSVVVLRYCVRCSVCARIPGGGSGRDSHPDRLLPAQMVALRFCTVL